jgi:hypothetical protein
VRSTCPGAGAPGEDAVNRLLQRYGFKGAPYPRSADLVTALRAEARTDEEQNLITDLFERASPVSAGPVARRPQARGRRVVFLQRPRRHPTGQIAFADNLTRCAIGPIVELKPLDTETGPAARFVQPIPTRRNIIERAGT